MSVLAVALHPLPLNDSDRTAPFVDGTGGEVVSRALYRGKYEAHIYLFVRGNAMIVYVA